MSGMMSRLRASLEFQRPAGPIRPQASVPVHDVCPHCKRVVVDKCCSAHGDVVPMRSAVINAGGWNDRE